MTNGGKHKTQRLSSWAAHEGTLPGLGLSISMHSFINPSFRLVAANTAQSCVRLQRQEHEGLPRASDIWHVNQRTSSGHVSGRQCGNYIYTNLWPPQYPIANISFELKAGLCKYLEAQLGGPQPETMRTSTNYGTARQKWTASPEKLAARRVSNCTVMDSLFQKIKRHMSIFTNKYEHIKREEDRAGRFHWWRYWGVGELERGKIDNCL